MGLFDWKHWLVLLVVVLVLFGGKRLKSLGADLAESIKGFRRSMASELDASANTESPSRLGIDSDPARR
ncbi:twin-arginine translocase TatA/TatE family subunit [Pseudomonas boanensis]|uniref:twin-arginine translocase TatA/TatE family subunit n=1 Tax=Metapseudomonas boanensis TaxID=2822138 RepID=UPI0035D45008